jgi:hypothetical protein
MNMLYQGIISVFLLLLANSCSSPVIAMEDGDNAQSSQCYWDRLPAESKLHILSFLPARYQQLSVFFDYARVSKDWQELIKA